MSIKSIIIEEILAINERQDWEKIEEVDALRKEIDYKLKRKEFSEINRVDNGDLLVATINFLRDQHVLEINFTNFVKRDVGGDYSMENDMNQINVYDCDVYDDGGNNVDVYYDKNTLNHELRHYLDWQRGNNVFARKYNKADDDKSSYYNNPAEYNAYIIQYLKQYVDRFGVKYISDDFQSFYNSLIKNTKIGEYKYKLNPDMQKKFMNRLYAFHERLKEVRDKKQNSVVTEEIQNIVDGVGDRYAQKQFGIPDKGKEFEKQWDVKQKTSNIEKENGKFVGSVKYVDNDIITNVYMNPKSLINFDRNVRAITDENGNLYITQIDASIFHSDMGDAMKEEGIDIGDVYEPSKNVAWHRIGGSNEFGLSISYLEECFYEGEISPNCKQGLLYHMKKAEQKNPQYKFVPVYWHDYKREKNL